jgi:hypothetical protein
MPSASEHRCRVEADGLPLQLQLFRQRLFACVHSPSRQWTPPGTPSPSVGLPYEFREQESLVVYYRHQLQTHKEREERERMSEREGERVRHVCRV